MTSLRVAIPAIEQGAHRRGMVALCPRPAGNYPQPYPQLQRASARCGVFFDVRVAWSEAWSRLRAEHPDIEEKLAEIEQACPTRARTIERLVASAGRWSGRAVRGEASPAELLKKLQVWQAAVLDALTELDHARAVRLCIDCGDSDVATVQPGLTSGRVCARCLREATP